MKVLHFYKKRASKVEILIISSGSKHFHKQNIVTREFIITM